MNFFEKIKEIVEQFQSSMKTCLPQLQAEVSNIITRKEKDIKTIEYLLDTLLSLQTAGIGREFFKCDLPRWTCPAWFTILRFEMSDL